MKKEKFKSGEKAIIIDNPGQYHGFNVGDIVTLVSGHLDWDFDGYWLVSDDSGGQCYVNRSDLKPIKPKN